VSNLLFLWNTSWDLFLSPVPVLTCDCDGVQTSL
jgi:hypothetical protein